LGFPGTLDGAHAPSESVSTDFAPDQGDEDAGTANDFSAFDDLSSRWDSGLAIDASVLVDLFAPDDFSRELDLSMQPDLAVTSDLAVSLDLAEPPDLAVAFDLSGPSDLWTPDLARVPRGTIVFGPPTTSTITTPGLTPQALAYGDFDEDGRLDIAVANWGVNHTGNITLLYGVGDGGFRTPVTLDGGPGPFDVVATDLNRDGHMDLISSSTALWCLFGDGLGGFTTTSYPGDIVTAATAMDSDEDGAMDVFALEANATQVRRWRGTSAGALTPSTIAPVAFQPFGLRAGRFSNDGRRGLAVRSYAIGAVPSIRILMLASGGTLEAEVAYPTLAVPVDVAVGDLDHDSVDDLVVSRSGGGFGILLANGDGTFRPEQHVAGGWTAGVSLVDVDTDGVLDVAIGNWSAGSLGIHRGQGDGTFTASQTIALGKSALRIIPPDLDADGLPDLVLLNHDDTVTVIMNRSF